MLKFQGACDASAGAQTTDEVFVVASDEDNVLRFYSWGSPGLPIAERGLSQFLGEDGLETDIEARPLDTAVPVRWHRVRAVGTPGPPSPSM